MARTKRNIPTHEPEDQSTALALPDTPVLVQAYGDPDQMQAILTRIETEALAVAPDLSTATSRKAIASLAFKVARSKTALDEIGKEITEEARRTVDTVNAVRRDARDRLDALKARVRAPLDEWGAAEKARVDDLEDRLRDFTDDLPTSDHDSATIETVLREIEAIPVDDTWDELKDKAEAAKANALHVLADRLRTAQQREAERAELERLRAEAAEREAAEQRRLAEERRKAEAERVERDKAEAVERAAKAAEERAAREKADAETRHQREKAEAEERHRRELDEAKRMAEHEASEARNRQARIKAAEDEARKAREADQARRATVTAAIRQALTSAGADDSVAGWVCDAIMAGRIPHVKVEM